ncbi:rhodanese-like domain-containing protein [Enterococcus sp. AZ196]|uniref:rhodanese-like domain-containing protein n=1 Tax=Enterococcus sp. AZ196 TaxID=2774659 RepID=UPI003D271BAC
MFKLFQKTPVISTKDLADKLEQSITLLDVRTPEEYRRGHIAKAVNYPLNKINRYQGKEKEVYVICQSGMRSKQAAKILKEKGYEATNVQGGMNRWQGPTRGGK